MILAELLADLSSIGRQRVVWRQWRGAEADGRVEREEGLARLQRIQAQLDEQRVILRRLEAIAGAGRPEGGEA